MLKLVFYTLLDPRLTLDNTSLKVTCNIRLAFEIFTTQRTAKRFQVQMNQLMAFQVARLTETHWTFTANIRLHAFVSKQVLLNPINAAEFLLTDVTREPCKLITQQQVRPAHVKLQSIICLKQISTEITLIWSTVAVYTTFMSLQVFGQSKTSITQRTLERFQSRVDPHVTVQILIKSKHLFTHVTFVWFLATVNSAVLCEMMRFRELFAANGTLKRSLS